MLVAHPRDDATMAVVVQVLNTNARAEVVKDPEGKNFPWPGVPTGWARVGQAVLYCNVLYCIGARSYEAALPATLCGKQIGRP